MYTKKLGLLSIFLLLGGIFSTTNATNLPEKMALREDCERVMEIVESMNVEEFLEKGTQKIALFKNDFLTWIFFRSIGENCSKLRKDLGRCRSGFKQSHGFGWTPTLTWPAQWLGPSELLEVRWRQQNYGLGQMSFESSFCRIFRRTPCWYWKKRVI